jgi:hypothetical protein
MYSSNSSKMEDELTMAFQGVMKKVMCMLRVEDATTAATSSSTQGPKRSVVGSNNDINVLNQSLLFVDVIRERTPKVSFTMTGIREICPYSSIREASIVLNEASINEKIYEVCFRSTEEEVQYTSHP